MINENKISNGMIHHLLYCQTALIIAQYSLNSNIPWFILYLPTLYFVFTMILAAIMITRMSSSVSIEEQIKKINEKNKK